MSGDKQDYKTTEATALLPGMVTKSSFRDSGVKKNLVTEGIDKAAAVIGQQAAYGVKKDQDILIQNTSGKTTAGMSQKLLNA
jgi:hypothetical protein